MEKPRVVLVSGQSPLDLNADQMKVLKKKFGEDVVLVRADVDESDRDALARLRHPLVLQRSQRLKGDVMIRMQSGEVTIHGGILHMHFPEIHPKSESS